MKKFYVTTPIYYVNDAPHIGHAYTNIATDVIARWHRLKGENVFFLTGTDEHGEKVEKAAKLANKDPKEFVDKVVKRFKTVLKNLNISNDDYIRTTDKRHSIVVNEVVKSLIKKGDIYKGHYEGWYCVSDETYLTETQLENNKCPICKKDVKKLREESYFFKLSKYQKWILDYIKKNKDFIQPEYRKKEIINRIKNGLDDLSITRTSFSWGLKFPNDEKHVMYVWVDALFNYISALQYPGQIFKKYWPADLHVIGKEILWFHAIIWPCFLKALNIKIPKTIFAHGWLTINGQKMSKSLGNVIDPIYLAEKYGIDQLRYFLIREIPFGHDGNFSEKALVNRINNELANNLGNLVNRTLTIIEKSHKNKVSGTIDKKLTSKLNIKKIDNYMKNSELDKAMFEIWQFINFCNKYVDEKKPWEKNDSSVSVLYNLVESLRIISILLYSFMPETAEKISLQLGTRLGKLKDCKFGLVKNYNIKKGQILFKKIE